jgi:biotin carboxyl carrier protein
LAIRSIRVRVGEQWYTVEVEDLSTSPVRVTVEGETFYVEVEGLPQARRSPAQPRAPRSAASEARTPTFRVSEKVIYSPMPGRVVAINVRPGDAVSAGQEVCVVEAMKMEQSIRSPQNGVVKEIRVQPMDSVRTNDPLIELE